MLDIIVPEGIPVPVIDIPATRLLVPGEMFVTLLLPLLVVAEVIVTDWVGVTGVWV